MAMSWLRRTVLIAAVAALSASHLIADDRAKTWKDEVKCPDSSQPWWCQFEQEALVSGAVVVDDDHLIGGSLGFGKRGYFAEGLRWQALSAFYQADADETAWGLRTDWSILMPYAMRWGGIGPLIALGLEYRNGELHPGFGGFVGLGGQLTIWTQRHWQFAVAVEHDFGVSSESRNAAQGIISFAHPKLGSRPYK